MLHFKEITTLAEYTPEKIVSSVPLPQTFWYGTVQEKFGRKVFRFSIERNGEKIAFAQFIEYPLFNGKTYWYAPYGPVIKEIDKESLSEIKDGLIKFKKQSQVVFIRLDFSPTLSLSQSVFAREIFTKSLQASTLGANFQPRHEWFVDLTKTENEILSLMHQKTRYSVRLAEKKGVIISVIGTENLTDHFEDFISLMKKTAQRNKFALHKDNYYKYFFEEIIKKGNVFLVEARHEGELLATHLIVIEGEIAHFVFGATSDNKKELCAPYLAHFKGMLEAKALSAKYYNFGAVSVEGENKHWDSVTLFKKKFGGETYNHSDLFDIVSGSFWYYVYVLRKFIKKYI